MNLRSIRYVLVGAYNAVVGYLIFFTLNYAFGHFLHYLAILAISYFLSLTHAYIWQRRIVFRSSAPWGNEYIRFLLVNLSGMGGNAVLLFLFVEQGMKLMSAQALSVAIVTIASYFGHRYFSFKST